MKRFLLVCFIVLTFLRAQERLGDWKALTSILNVRDVIYTEEAIYAATGGGVFEIKDEQYSTYTTIDGLNGVDLSSLTLDHQSNLWIGGDSPFGFLQVYDLKNNRSIASFDFGLTSIIDIQINGMLTWVLFQDGVDVGFMKFIFNGQWEYRDSYRNYPEGSGKINCFAINDSTVFLGMENGLYSARINDNMKDPNNWTKQLTDFNEEITSIHLNEDRIIFTTRIAIYEYNSSNNTLNEIDYTYELTNAGNLNVTPQGYWFSDNENLYLKSDDIDLLVDDRFEITSISHQSGQIIAGLSSGFLFVNENEGDYTTNRLIPNSPSTGSFSAITILEDGRLVGGSGHGISIFNGVGWRNILEIKTTGSMVIQTDYDFNFFIGDTVEYDFGGYIADLEQGPDGLVYCAIRGSRVFSSNPPRWSGGVIVLDVDDPTNISVIDTTFLSYHTTSSNSIPYQVTLDIEFDLDGNLWIANPYCINGNNPIHVRSPDGIWKHFGSSETSTRISQSPGSVVFDSWGRTWVSAFQAEEANLGIYPNGGISMLSYEGQPYDPASFNWNIINNSGTVWSLGMGINDRVYYLTPSGLNYYDIDGGYDPVIRENPYSYFPNISFGNGAGISIDRQGNIWTYSPSQGVHVLLENTSYWPDINGFRTNNSPLLSDEIRDIDFNEKLNLAYIATSKGVNILRVPFGVPKTSYRNIKVFPSPFYLPSDKPMKVDGLLYGSSMMVTTLDGKVVRHIRSQGLEIDGDQLSWDGRDRKGDYVSTGVYLLLIYDNEGTRIEERITVIKE